MAQRRRTDGFSDDGLSYSVATDFDKQLGQALAQIDARTAAPRFTPGAMVERPDAPNLLQQELLAPVMAARNAYLGVEPKRPVAPKTYEIGNELVSLDPTTGRPSVLYSAPKKAASPRATDFEQSQRRLAEDEVKRARDAWEKIPDDKENLEAKISAKNRELAAEKRLRKMFETVKPNMETSPVISDAIEESLMRGFIGEKGGKNLFTAPTPKETIPTKQGEIVRTLKGGRRAIFDANKNFVRYAD